MTDVEAGRGGAGKRRDVGSYSNREELAAWTAWIVPLFVVACVAVFATEMYVNDCPAQTRPSGRCVARFLRRFSFQPLHENPLLGPSSSTLDKLGALQWYKVVHQNQAWRLVTCIWLHAGLVHLLANMVCLLFVGIRLERQFGFLRIAIIYLLSGFGGAVLSALLLRNITSVGASGALFGFLGAMVSELFINWTIYSNRVAALLTLMFIIVVNLAIGLFPHVDNFAHIGGFLSGFLLGFVLLIRPQFGWMQLQTMPSSARVTSKYKAYQCVLWVISLLLLIAGFTIGLVMLFRGVNGNDHCQWCHYLNCVRTSSWSCKD
ncbi:RHOMBOID-like protein 3 [Canna indica]|uniref:RHOMBOID-like protein n=1 Tax=Canna indica TaxID=4628 RepID=A0AAQ3L4P4_9LILI|nr:RHOMBOID-like protein 3 [Canna indica]